MCHDIMSKYGWKPFHLLSNLVEICVFVDEGELERENYNLYEQKFKAWKLSICQNDLRSEMGREIL